MPTYIYKDELYHHGIKGQKWGQRRFQNEDGSLTAAGRQRYDVGEARKAALLGGAIGLHKYRKTHDYEGYKREKAAAKEKAKADKKAQLNKNIEEYGKAFDRAERYGNKTDKAWKDVKQQYHDLARTPVGRVIEAYKAQSGKGSEAANKWSRDFDKASAMSEKLDTLWTDAGNKYRNTGKTAISRVFNVASYDLNRRKQLMDQG